MPITASLPDHPSNQINETGSDVEFTTPTTRPSSVVSIEPTARLGIPFIIRAPLLLSTSFLTGLVLGSAHGAPIAAYRYRAENAHRMPTTTTGWFLYHKSKNYHSIVGGVKEGVKFGGVITGWALLFMATEEVLDTMRGQLFAGRYEETARGQKDVASTVTAAMATAGVYSWKKRMDMFTAARTSRTALKYSLIYGVVQDLAATLRGSRPAYVDWAFRRTFGESIRYEQ